MTVSGGLDAKTLTKSSFFWGEPVTTSRDGDFSSSSEEALRTSAVTVWLRDNASLIMGLPVLPLPPRIRVCILAVLDLGFVLGSWLIS